MKSRQRVALFGAGGQLGSAIARLAPPHWEILYPVRSGAGFTGPAVTAWLDLHEPHVILNAAAYNAVELAEQEPALAHEVNAGMPAHLAAWAAARGVYMAHFSTDYVFSGEQTQPINETATPAPLNAYGASKAAGEILFLQSQVKGCLIRTSAVFGKRNEGQKTPHNFIEKILARASLGTPFPVRNDLTFCPTWADDLSSITIQKVEQRATGVFHCTSAGPTNWFEWAREILAQAGKNPQLVEASRGDHPPQARRPRYTVLEDSHHHASKHWRIALEIYLRDRQP